MLCEIHTGNHMIHQTVVTHIQEGPLNLKRHWMRPEFTPDDGIAEMGSLSIMDGMVLGVGFIDNEGIHCCGSGVMVAPGLLVTATHVAEETRGTSGMAFSFLSDGQMRLWALHQLHVLSGREESPLFNSPPKRISSDVALVSCSLTSAPVDNHPLLMAHLEVCVPTIGERLWAVGYRDTSKESSPGATMFCTSGVVTECHLEGRGSHLPGPCVEMSMSTLGGMSGGPVFNSEGHVVGIVSSSYDYEADDLHGPTYVSLIWPAFVGTVDVQWPKGFWPTGLIGITLAQDLGCACIHGTASFPVAGIPFDRDKFDENYNEQVEEILEKNAIGFIESLPNHALKHLLNNNKRNPLPLSTFSKFNIDIVEGVEDMKIVQCLTTSKGLYIDCVHDFRILQIDLEMTLSDFESQKGLFPERIHNIEFGSEVVTISCFVRPYLRVSFTHNAEEGTQSDYCVSRVFFYK